MKPCETCGELRDENDPPHETVTRIVRPGHIFSGRRAGQAVGVEPKHISHRSTLLGTMSIEEWELLLAARNKPAAPKGPTSVDMAQQFSERVRKEYQRDRDRKAFEEAKKGPRPAA